LVPITNTNWPTFATKDNLDHGLRCGEIAGLPPNAIDLAEGQFTFYRSKVSTEQTHKLSADTLRAAVAYLMKDGPASGGLLRDSIKGGRLTGVAISERAINKRVGELGKRIGVASLSPYDLRHYWTSAAGRGKSDPKAMMNAGGWKSPAMPIRYAEDDQIADEGVTLE
jgi:integrase